MQRHLLLPLLLSTFIALLGIGIIIPVMPVFAASLGAGGLTLGFIIAAFSITRALCQPVVGNLSDRWGRKGFLICGLAVYGLVGLLIPNADSVHGLVLIRTLHGVGSAMIVPVAMAYVSDLSPVGQEGRYMGMLNIAIFTGIGCGPLLGGFFTDLWGMAAAFYVMGGLSFLAMILIIVQLPSLPESSSKSAARSGILASFAKMLSTRRTFGILLARMATMIIMVPTMAFLPLLMDQRIQASALQIGLVIAARTLLNAVLQTHCGRLADRYDKVRLLQYGCLAVSSVMWIIPLAHSFATLIGIFAFLGCAEAIIWPTLGALATEEGRIYGQGTIMGVFNLAMSTGVFIGAVGAGFISDRFSFSAAFMVSGAVVFVLTMAAGAIIAGDNRPIGGGRV